MREVGCTETRARFAEVLRNVEDGETVAITRHGKTIAHLVPAPKTETMTQAERDAAVDRLLALREKLARTPHTPMTNEEILAARHEGHRL